MSSRTSNKFIQRLPLPFPKKSRLFTSSQSLTILASLVFSRIEPTGTRGTHVTSFLSYTDIPPLKRKQLKKIAKKYVIMKDKKAEQERLASIKPLELDWKLPKEVNPRDEARLAYRRAVQGAAQEEWQP